MASDAVPQLLEQSQWVIEGTIQKVGASTMPEVPPCTRTQSPLLTVARMNMFCQQVKNVSGMAAASTIDSAGGTGNACGS